MLRSAMSALCTAVLVLAPPATGSRVAADPPRRAAARAQAQTIDLDLKQADITNVLRLLAEVGGVNLVIGEEVTGEVTLRLRRVAWEDALRLVLASKGLEMQREGNIIRVASAASFAAERKVQLDARAQCLASAPLRTRMIPVNYARAHELAAHVKATLSPRGTVAVDARTNTLIVRDVDCD